MVVLPAARTSPMQRMPLVSSRVRRHVPRRPERMTAWHCRAGYVWASACPWAFCGGYGTSSQASFLADRYLVSGIRYPVSARTLFELFVPSGTDVGSCPSYRAASVPVSPRTKRHLRSMEIWFLSPKWGTGIPTRPASSLPSLCLACFGILDRPARVRVFPGRLGRIIGPDVRGALACLGPLFLLPAHPLAWGRHRRGVYNPAAGGLVSPIARLLFKTCKQGFKRTRPGQLLPKRPDRLLVRDRLANPKPRKPQPTQSIPDQKLHPFGAQIMHRHQHKHLEHGHRVIGRPPPFERSGRSNDASGPARNISKST